MMNARTSLLVAAASLATWIVLTYGLQVASGWVHIPLAVAVGFVARAIVVGDDRTP